MRSALPHSTSRHSRVRGKTNVRLPTALGGHLWCQHQSTRAGFRIFRYGSPAVQHDEVRTCLHLTVVRQWSKPCQSFFLLGICFCCNPALRIVQVDANQVVDLATFMGLKCSLELAEQFLKVESHVPASKYTDYGLPLETLKWMNSSMASLLPDPMLARWGLTMTDR